MLTLRLWGIDTDVFASPVSNVKENFPFRSAIASSIVLPPILPITTPYEGPTSPLRASLFLSAGPQRSRAHPEAPPLVAAFLLGLHGFARLGVIFAQRRHWAGEERRPGL